jgi:hypothetical protein
MTVTTKEKTVFVTDDGREFDTEAAAKGHEATVALEKWADENGVGRGGGWSQDMFLGALESDAGVLAPILQAIADAGDFE